jgi:hypothetical protein
MGRIKTTIKKEISSGISSALADLSQPTVDSLNQGQASGEDAVRDMDVGRIADGMKDIPDPVNSAITNIADQILSGKTYDKNSKDFVDLPGTIDYLDRVFTDFGFAPPRGTTGI